MFGVLQSYKEIVKVVITLAALFNNYYNPELSRLWLGYTLNMNYQKTLFVFVSEYCFFKVRVVNIASP